VRRNGVGPGAGGILSVTDSLIEPKVQVTTDHGTNWSDVAATSDYLTALDGHPLPAEAFGAPTLATAHFQLVQPQTNINGIRIIGSEGGTASGGFLGVFDLAVNINRGTQAAGLHLVSLSKVSGQMHFEFDSKNGATHVVQFKNTLGDANWQTLTTLQGDGTRLQVNDTVAGDTRFYRVTTQ